jgi:polar amino acid transport system substrate-binding protein
MISTVKLVADPYPPYQFEKDGEVIGMDHDIIFEAFKVHGVEARTELLDWDECVALLDAGKAEGIFQITPTPEREKQFRFSKPLRTAHTLFFKKKADSISLNDSSSLGQRLGDLKIGVLAGYSYGDEVDRLKRSMKVEKTLSEELLRGLLRGEFSLALLDKGVAAFLVNKLVLEGVEPVRGFEIPRQLHVAFRKGLREHVQLFNSGLSEIKKNGIYESVYRRYE